MGVEVVGQPGAAGACGKGRQRAGNAAQSTSPLACLRENGHFDSRAVEGPVVATAGWSVRGGGVVRRLLDRGVAGRRPRDGHPRGPARGGRGRGGPALYLVTLAGPGTAGDHGVLPDRAAGAASRTAPWPGWARRRPSTAGRPRSTASPCASPPGRPPSSPRTRASSWSSGTRFVAWPAVRAAAAVPSGPVSSRGGAGTVIGVVDSGISPESPLFAPVPGLGRAPRAFHGDCVGGADFDTDRLRRQAGRCAVVRQRLRCRPTSAPPPRSRRATTTATAPRWPRSPRATPGCRCASTSSGSAATAAWRRRPGWRSTRRAGWHPTPRATAARPPTS